MAADETGNASSTLNELIQTCKDGEHGFQSAAGLVEDINLRRLFESYAQQRAEFAAELQLEVSRMAADRLKSGHITAALRRSWFDTKVGVAGTDDGSVISECERRESDALGRFQVALDAELPPHLRAIAERQLLQVQEAHRHLCSLERVHSRMA